MSRATEMEVNRDEETHPNRFYHSMPGWLPKY